jgi:uracil DNA glycosylase
MKSYIFRTNYLVNDLSEVNNVNNKNICLKKWKKCGVIYVKDIYTVDKSWI